MLLIIKHVNNTGQLKNVINLHWRKYLPPPFILNKPVYCHLLCNALTSYLQFITGSPFMKQHPQ